MAQPHLEPPHPGRAARAARAARAGRAARLALAAGGLRLVVPGDGLRRLGAAGPLGPGAGGRKAAAASWPVFFSSSSFLLLSFLSFFFSCFLLLFVLLFFVSVLFFSGAWCGEADFGSKPILGNQTWGNVKPIFFWGFRVVTQYIHFTCIKVTL